MTVLTFFVPEAVGLKKELNGAPLATFFAFAAWVRIRVSVRVRVRVGVRVRVRVRVWG